MWGNLPWGAIRSILLNILLQVLYTFCTWDSSDEGDDGSEEDVAEGPSCWGLVNWCSYVERNNNSWGWCHSFHITWQRGTRLWTLSISQVIWCSRSVPPKKKRGEEKTKTKASRYWSSLMFSTCWNRGQEQEEDSWRSSSSGVSGDRYNNIIDWQICTSRYSGFLWKFFSCCDIFWEFFFCSAPDKESGPASWDFSARVSLNQTLKEVKITGLILTVCPSREYPILLLLRFPLYVLYSSCQQAIVENMLLFWEMMIVMTQSSCTRWVSVFINVSSGVTQVSDGMIFQSSSEVSDGMILQSSSDVSCGMIFRCSSEGSCGIDRDLFFCFFF